MGPMDSAYEAVATIVKTLTPHPPHRRLTFSTHRQPTQIQDIFVGIAFLLSPESEDGKKARPLEYTIVLHDGTGVTESETYDLKVETFGKDESGKNEEAKRVSLHVLDQVGRIQREKGMNIRMVAIAKPLPSELADRDGVEFLPKIWLHVDAIPFVTSPATTMFTSLPAPSTQASATAAIAAGIKHLHPATISATTAEVDDKDHHVRVDCNGEIQLCHLLQYEQSTSPELWKRFIALSTLLRENKTSISFFSATPQGGGVALMRHALIRLWKLVGLDVKWYVPEGHPAVFDITKRKIHNVLQGVAPRDVELSASDKKWFEMWTEQNYEMFWRDGALDASVIVIDDPQLTAMIPIIRKHRPNAKIIFRSHIQIQSDLTDDPKTSQHRVWNYLFHFIKDVDLFLAHPVKFFVPRNVHETLPVLYMAPSTDPLDGLNKPYGMVSVAYYRQKFNSLSAKQCGVTIDWERRYVCQIARFDPSKGIQDLLAGYLEFRQNLLKLNPPVKEGPQLIVMGHGSIDDPDGAVIYDKAIDTLSTSEYALIQKDVAVVRAPPSDSLLGCILQGAWVATQLSTREGFEVKVTEAINKRVPIIASDAGGIPLQVKDGINGYIVPVSQPSEVATLLTEIFTGEKTTTRPLATHEKLDSSSSSTDPFATTTTSPKEVSVEGAQDIENGDGTDPNAVAEQFVKNFERPMIKISSDLGSTSEDFWTVGNAVRWMLLTAKLVGLEVGEDESSIVENEIGNGNKNKNGNETSSSQSQKESTSSSLFLLRSMGVGQGILSENKDEHGGNVWKMVMGDDLKEGDGQLI